MRTQYRLKSGFSLFEALVGVVLFSVIFISIMQSYQAIMKSVRYARIRTQAVALANEQFEIIRNLPYKDVGNVSGIPVGKIPQSQSLVRGNVTYLVKINIRNIDDPFDSTLGGTPNDTSPADYKLVEVEISAPEIEGFKPIVLTTNIAPKGLETASNNGALFIKVFDANGQPIQGASVHLENKKTTTTLIINDVTNASGLLQIVDAPTGTNAYEITVTKEGYSTDKTYAPGATDNPNPIKPHATVAMQQVTQVSFAIDQLSTLNVSTVGDNCTNYGNVSFNLRGAKTIGANPTVYKYNQTFTTDSGGQKSLNELEWDSYILSFTDVSYDLIGTIPSASLALAPNSTQGIMLVVAPKNSRTLLVNVKDAATQLPLSGATVLLESGSYSYTKTTGRGFINQTDWSSGSGQATSSDSAKFFDNSNTETNSPAGDIKLTQVLGEYASNGWLESSTFDTGSASNFHEIIWSPNDQPAAVGTSSVKFQIAGGNDFSTTTWEFIGPGGSTTTYFDSSNNDVNGLIDGKRYFRYKLFLSTASSTYTPNVSDIALTFTTACMPPGQTYFSGLASSTYTLTVSKDGKQNNVSVIDINQNWQQQEILMQPQ